MTVVVAVAAGCGAESSKQTTATGMGSASERPSVPAGGRAQPARPTRGGLPSRSSRRAAEHAGGGTIEVVDVRSGGATHTDSSSAAEVIEITRKALRGGRGERGGEPDPVATLNEDVRDALRDKGGPAAEESSEAAPDRILHRAAAQLRRVLREG